MLVIQSNMQTQIFVVYAMKILVHIESFSTEANIQLSYAHELRKCLKFDSPSHQEQRSSGVVWVWFPISCCIVFT